MKSISVANGKNNIVINKTAINAKALPPREEKPEKNAKPSAHSLRASALRTLAFMAIE